MLLAICIQVCLFCKFVLLVLKYLVWANKWVAGWMLFLQQGKMVINLFYPLMAVKFRKDACIFILNSLNHWKYRLWCPNINCVLKITWLALHKRLSPLIQRFLTSAILSLMHRRNPLKIEHRKTVGSYHVLNVFNHILFCRQKYRILNNDKTENNNWLRYWGGRRSSHHDGAFQTRRWRHRYHVCKRKRGYWKRLQKHPACSQDMWCPTCMWIQNYKLLIWMSYKVRPCTGSLAL